MGKKAAQAKTAEPAKKPKARFHDKKLIIVDMWNCQVALAVNLTANEVVEHVIEQINRSKYRHEAREREILTDLAAGLDDWGDIPSEVGRMIPCGSAFMILTRFDKDNFREAVGILAHEVTHVVQYLLRDRRVPLQEDTEEVYAYLTEYLMVEFLRALYD